MSPSRDQLEHLRQPLTPGERKVLELFDSKLSPEWEIYIQPHLNGLRPDFVLLNPDSGIAVFEVKDWNLDSMEYYVEESPHQRRLMGYKDGNQFSIQKNNPISKVLYYKEAIYQLYCPRLAHRKGIAAITAGVIFPYAEGERVRQLLSPFLDENQKNEYAKYYPITGGDELSKGMIDRIFPEAIRKSSNLMRGKLADDLRGWLVEPDFSKEQRQPLELDANQRMLAESRTDSGFRRIKGPAGSGKSLVLAVRAAKLADEGKSVLVVTYNITLWHYLRDLVSRSLRDTKCHKNIVYLNFHSWCKDICIKTGEESSYDSLWSRDQKSNDDVLNIRLPNLVSSLSDLQHAPRYDAILVDEGQDYRPNWWNTLRKYLKTGGEMVLVADATQDVYRTAHAWTEQAMAGAGFRGAWAQLDVSYRLPPSSMPLLQDFAARFLPKEGTELPIPAQGEFDLFPAALRWVQCAPEQSVEICISELKRLMQQTGADGLAMADITFLASQVKVGSLVVEQLLRNSVNCIATFDIDEEARRRQKMAFYLGDARIKATTLHSFKGWESPLVVVYIDHSMNEGDLPLVYAGLTRLKRRKEGSFLTVVCAAPSLCEYGSSWPEFEANGSQVEAAMKTVRTVPFRASHPLRPRTP